MPRPPMEAPTRTGSPLPGERRCHRGAGRRGRPILGAQSPRYEAVSAVAAVPALHKSSISADVLSPFEVMPARLHVHCQFLLHLRQFGMH